MLLELIVGDFGPLWVSTLSTMIEKSLCGAALYSIAHADQVKSIHDNYVMKTELSKSNSAINNVVNVFDVNK